MLMINLFLKRFFDIFLSILGLIIISPLLFIIALIIKITSRGPIIFKQKRIGLYGKIFTIYKFRTMIVNAENIGQGLKITSENDVRITKIGKFLRKTSLDELPQIFNVIGGSMSLIGPRPPVVYHPYKGYLNYPVSARTRFNMRPGMTGLTQISVRNGVSWEKRIVIDNEYIKKFNVFLDLKILLYTFLIIIKPQKLYLE